MSQQNTALSLGLQETFGTDNIREISRSKLAELARKFGVTVSFDKSRSSYDIAPDKTYSENHLTAARSCLLEALEKAKNFPAKTPGELFPGAEFGRLLARHLGDLPLPKRIANDTAEKFSAVPRDAFSKTPALSIGNYQGETFSRLHLYTGKSSKAAYLDEFESLLNVSVRREDDKVFNVYMPAEAGNEPVPGELAETISLVLLGLQKELQARGSFNRESVKHLIGKALDGSLRSTFHAAASEPAPAKPEPKTAADSIIDSAAQEAGGSKLTEADRALIKKINLYPVEPRTPNQANYVRKAEASDITFCIAPAGTGKTYLAVYVALKLLTEGKVNRVVVTRPAVEAGEKLGFLPGDMQEKMDPYMKPIYKSMMKLLAGGDLKKGNELLKQLMQRKIIEISPLAFMRGDEYENAAIVGDEFQNATEQQLVMFMTRIGEGGRMIIVGDPEQTDLKPSSLSVLVNVAEDFKKAAVPGISVAHMTEADAVRHRLLPQILKVIRDGKAARETAGPVPAGPQPRP